jgi:pectate lyase
MSDLEETPVTPSDEPQTSEMPAAAVDAATVEGPEDTAFYFRDLPIAPSGPRRSGLGLLTSLLVLALVAGLGFLGGVKLQKDRAGTTSAARPAGFAFAGAGGRQGGGAAGGAGAAGTTAGTVKLVDGSSIYVTDQNGDVIKITTSPASKVRKMNDAAVGDVRPGDSVFVQGPAGSDGSVAALSVTDNGPSGTGGAAGGGRASRGGATGGGAAGG